MATRRSLLAARISAFIIDVAAEGIIAVLVALSGALFATIYSEVGTADPDHVQATVRLGTKIGLLLGILYAGLLNRVFYMKLTEATVGLHVMGLRIWNPEKEHTVVPLFLRMCLRYLFIHTLVYPMEVSWRAEQPKAITPAEIVKFPTQQENERKAA